MLGVDVVWVAWQSLDLSLAFNQPDTWPGISGRRPGPASVSYLTPLASPCQRPVCLTTLVGGPLVIEFGKFEYWPSMTQSEMVMGWSKLRRLRTWLSARTLPPCLRIHDGKQPLVKSKLFARWTYNCGRQFISPSNFDLPSVFNFWTALIILSGQIKIETTFWYFGKRYLERRFSTSSILRRINIPPSGQGLVYKMELN